MATAEHRFRISVAGLMTNLAFLEVDLMKLATYTDGTGPRLGVVHGDQMLDLRNLADAAGESVPATMVELIGLGSVGLDQVQRLIARPAQHASRSLTAVQLLAPIPRPRKNVLCVGMNYLDHAIESARSHGREYEPLAHPAFFTKAPTTVIGPYDDIPFPTVITEQVDWEVELGVVIGQAGKNLTVETALDYIFGYIVVNDVSARDIQNRHGGQFFKGKSLDGFCPLGPWIVTADEIPDPQALRLQTRVNGVVKQDAHTGDMIFSVAKVLAALSEGMTLEPGDILATGTPSGVGMGRTPQEWLHPGDVVGVEVERIGMLRNRVTA
jgi:2-keto-4-pentenoate hydratase/2-oxohepta-3-ene-1,7-dioic acid hydratase in catechol pathway